MLYVLSPGLSGADVSSGASFSAGMRERLHLQSVKDLASDLDMLRSVNGGDVVVAFNPSTGSPSQLRPRVLDFFQRAIQAGAPILPVALDRSSQQPPPPLDAHTSFPVHEVMTSYSLQPSQMAMAGAIFARRVLAEVRPTFAKHSLQLFFSYCRADGEGLVREIAGQIATLHQRPYRDLGDFPTGRPVAKEIIASLDQCDVLVLIDTPEAAGSEWIKAELCLALGMGLPIVWVRVGHAGGRSELPVWPAAIPDLDIDWPTSGAEAMREVSRQILDSAFAAAGAHVRRAQACLNRAESLASISSLDPKRQIFCLKRPRRLGRYELRPETHIVQLFGRRPSREDGDDLMTWLEERDYAPHDDETRRFDLAIMMSPAPGGFTADSGPVISTHGVGFVTALAGTSTAASGASSSDAHPELLLLGAFPRGSNAGREVTDAAHEVATLWLSRGGRIRFGGHPTITPLVTHVALTEIPGHERERVTILQSLYFVTPAALREVADLATVVETPATGTAPEDRGPSLTLMRERLIADSTAVAAVIIGGRTDEGGAHVPGVDEEVQLVQASGIPAYVLGGTGGQAAVLADAGRGEQPPWSGLGNSLPPADNEWIATTDDYWGAADMIWRTAVGDA